MVESGQKLIVHVDLDAFFASVEQNDNPDLRGKPVIIGADPLGGRGRGVVSTASYEARKFGVRSAMPISRAFRLCPHGIFIEPRMDRYIEVSRVIMEIFSYFSPLVEPLSVDEAFLDCTGMEKLMGSPQDIGRKIKDRIKNETGLTASVGIAGNKFTAKVASDLEKPDGLTICPPGAERDFLASLPVSCLWGAGPKTTQMLRKFGLSTIGDVANSDPESLTRRLGKSGIRFYDLANGRDDRIIESGHVRKSISREHTFLDDTDDRTAVEKVLYRICEKVAASLRNEGLFARTVFLKVRLEGFETHTRSVTLDHPFNDTKTFRDKILEEFGKFDTRERRIRLIGAGMSSLTNVREEGRGQLDLFSSMNDFSNSDFCNRESSHSGQTDQILDKLRTRFPNRVMRAVFIKKNI